MKPVVPDRWVVLDISSESRNMHVQKVLCGWYGGFAESDRWQLNSGIAKVNEFDDRFEFEGYSGSLYVCYKHARGVSIFLESVINRLLNSIEENGDDTKVIVLRNYPN